MKPKPYESTNIPTITPPTPVHREGFTTSQLIPIRRSSDFERNNVISWTEESLSKIAHSQPHCAHPTPARSILGLPSEVPAGVFYSAQTRLAPQRILANERAAVKRRRELSSNRRV